MTAPSGRLQRSELMYREMAQKQAPIEQTILDDPRWEAIDERMLTRLSTKDIDAWTKDEWKIYSDILKARKSKARQTAQPIKTLATMSLDEIKSSLRGNRSTSRS